MTRKARARVVGRFDRAFPTEATVEIDRAAGLITVRPLRKRRSYTLPLASAAEFVVHKVIVAEVAEKKREGQKRRHSNKVKRGLL